MALANGNYSEEQVEGYLRESLEGPTSIFANVPAEERVHLGPKKHDMILQCLLGREDCSDNIEVYVTSGSFNCYTFKPSNQYSFTVGVDNGLSLTLAGKLVTDFREKYVFHSNKKNTRTLRAIFHEPDTRPSEFHNSFELVPGISTSIGLKQRNMKRINTPQSRCSPTPVLNDNRKLTYARCVQRCLAEYFYEQCGCYPTSVERDISEYCFHVDLEDIEGSLERGLCEIDTTNIINKIPAGNKCFKSVCKWSCSEIEYVKSVTFSVWPDEARIESLLERLLLSTPQENSFALKWFWARLTKLYGNTSTKLEKYLIDEDKIFDHWEFDGLIGQLQQNGSYRDYFEDKYFHLDIPKIYKNLSSLQEAETRWVKDTFYRLNVYFQEEIVEVHQQVLSQSFTDLWSAIGGACGLWLGISSITGVEIIELCVTILKSCIKFSKRKCSNQVANFGKN